MRTILIFAALLLAGAAAAPAMAQEGISGDAAVTYRWVHTNAAPGDCGCFGLNGGGSFCVVECARPVVGGGGFRERCCERRADGGEFADVDFGDGRRAI